MQQFTWAHRLPRIEYTAPVWVRTPSHELLRAETHNVGEGGIFVVTPKMLPLDSHVTCDVSIDGHRRFLNGRVAWARTPADAGWDNPPGLGLEFCDLRDDDADVLRDCVMGRLEKTHPVRVWLPGSVEPVTATAVLTKRGIVLRTRLPAFQLDSNVLFEFIGGDQEIVGKLGRVQVVVDDSHPVPTLQVELAIDRPI